MKFVNDWRGALLTISGERAPRAAAIFMKRTEDQSWATTLMKW